MNSIDIAHVPPPNPKTFWGFKVSERRVVWDQIASLTLIEILEKGARFEMELQGRKLVDVLNLNKPCVAIRHASGVPLVTLTLRKIDPDSAYLQVTVNPALEKGWVQ
jgi:hypothetical protein